MAHVKLILAFFALVILSAGVLVAVWFYKNIVAPERAIVQGTEVRAAVPEGEKPAGPDLGKRQFAKAVELLQSGDLQATLDQLYYLMQYYPDSATYPDAKRIVGEINLDLLLSEIPIEGKTEYTVVSGDALSRIARNHKCTINYIMRVNGRTTDKIFKGDRLTVYPLDQFSIVIDKSDAVIRVERDGKLFKEYPVQRMALPPMVRAPTSTTVQDLVAWGDDGRRMFDDIDYLGANKWIATAKKGLLIRATRDHTVVVAAAKPAPGDEAEEGGDGASGAATTSLGQDYGVMVAPDDIEEMFAYLRGGTPLRLVE